MSNTALNTEKADNAKNKLVKSKEKSDKAQAKAELSNILDAAGAEFGIAQEVATAKAIMNAPEAIGNVWVGASKQANPILMALHGALGTAMVVAPIANNAVFFALIEDSIRMNGDELTVSLELGPTERNLFCRGMSMIGLDINGC